jgi:predicted dehydrogenase
VSVRVAVIGTGWWATRAHLPALLANPDAEAVALVDPDEANLARAAEAFGVERTFSDTETMLAETAIDAAVIAVPHAFHAPVATACLERRAHVLLEKPMTIDPAEAWALVELARRVDRELILGYPWHYNTQVLEVRAAIADGRIGRIEAVTCLFASVVREFYRGQPEPYREVMGYPVNAPRARTFTDTDVSGGGQGQWQVTHAAALLQWLVGLEPTEVAAFTENQDVSMDLVDALSIRFANGAIGTLASTGGAVIKQPEVLEYRIFGTEGHIFFDVYEGTASIRTADGSVEALAILPEELRYPEAAPADNLVAIAAHGATNGSPAELGARTVALVDAMYRSATDGSATTLYRHHADQGVRP